ncbi:alpha/beta hydrolase [Novosphingobium sp. TH158]|uniref:alpha/beta hydrolase n=1 Tax=Novosphingobium sp. TH158 TaxID=2067455 RepID=UPI0020B109B0|nr:alpha/beta hydrolase [Novosphingobium sp. TH158]
MRLPARVIPLPQTISEEARAFLANPMFGHEPVVPALDDIEGWRRHCAESNARMVMMMRMQRAGIEFESQIIRLSNADLHDVRPARIVADDRAVLYIHGGAFIVGGGEAAGLAAAQIADMIGLRTLSVDYRMPPDHPFPAGLDDCVEAYRLLLESYAPGNIAVYGGSAGANLAVTTILKARDEGLPLPAACVLHSPVSDLRQIGDTFTTNTELDVVLKRPGEWMPALYSGGHDLTDPLLSPALADFSAGFPPTVLTSGTRDLLLSDTVRLHRAMRKAGLRADLHVWEAMCHGMAHTAPEAQELLGEHIAFMREMLRLD